MKAAILSLVTAVALTATAGTADARPRYYGGYGYGARYFPTFVGSSSGYGYGYPAYSGYNYGYGYPASGISISFGRGVGVGYGYPSYGYSSWGYTPRYYSSGWNRGYYRGWRW